MTKSSITCLELPAVGIYEIDLNFPFGNGSIVVHTWGMTEASKEVLEADPRFIIKDQSLPCPIIYKSYERPDVLPAPVSDVEEFIRQNQHEMFELRTVLTDSVRTRIENHPKLCKDCVKEKLNAGCDSQQCCEHAKIGVLFSGGVDSTVIAALVDDLLPKTETIDLLNVAFEQPSPNGPTYEVPDRKTSLQALEELKVRDKIIFFLLLSC